MPLVISTDIPAANEPVTITEAKEFLRLDGSDEIPLIRRCITAARQIVSYGTGVTLGTTTYTLILDQFPAGDHIDLQTSPVVSITSITYLDTAGASQTMTASDYELKTAIKPNRVALAYSASWPTARTIGESITVTFIAGYTSTAVVPATLKQEVLYWVSQFYENRDMTVDKVIREVPMTGRYLSYMNRARGFV